VTPTPSPSSPSRPAHHTHSGSDSDSDSDWDSNCDCECRWWMEPRETILMERACFGVGGEGQEDRKAGKWNAHFWFNYFGAIHARANSHPPFTPPTAPPTFLVPLIWKALVFHFAVCYLLFGIWYLLSTWNNSNPRFRWWSGRKMQGLWFAYAFVHNNMHIYIYIPCHFQTQLFVKTPTKRCGNMLPQHVATWGVTNWRVFND